MSGARARTLEALIAAHGLKPHPYDGWFSERPSPDGAARCWRRLLGLGDFVSWHQMAAARSFTLIEGGPLAISISKDGVGATSQPLSAARLGPFSVPKDAYIALEPLGALALFDELVSADLAMTDARFMPESWAPGRPSP